MKHIIYTLLLVIPFLYSCTPSPTKNKMSGAEEIVIDAQNQNALSLDSLIKKVEFIKLETTDNNIIGMISQVLFTDSLIIVADNESAKSINVFDIKGKFKYQIGRVGQGPGEYTDITYICINPQTNHLVVFDKGQNKEISYTLEGRYVSSANTPFMLDYFLYLDNGCKAYYKAGLEDPTLGRFKNNPLIVTDSSNNVIYGDCVDFYKYNQFHYVMQKSLRKFANDVYFSPNFSNEIYVVTDSMIIPKYYINIAWNGMPPIDNQITDEKFVEYCNQYYIFKGDFVELQDLTYINIMAPQGYPFVVYSHSKKQTFFSTDQGSHPLFPFLKNMPPYARYGDNAVVFTVSAYHLMINKEEWYKHEPDRQFLEDMYGGLTEDANPVLVICHLNERIGYEE